jgi:hypothetical protein
VDSSSQQCFGCPLLNQSWYCVLYPIGIDVCVFFFFIFFIIFFAECKVFFLLGLVCVLEWHSSCIQPSMTKMGLGQSAMELQQGVGAYETLMNQNMVAQLAQMQQDQQMIRQAREVQAAQNRVAAAAAQNAAQKAAQVWHMDRSGWSLVSGTSNSLRKVQYC